MCRASTAVLAALVGLLIWALAVPAAQAQVPDAAAPVTIDGPDPGIEALSGMAVARDGTGGVVYLKDVLGVRRAFVSRLLGGVFQPPEQVDTGLPGPSSQPVIAAGNGGLLLTGFINGGRLYVVNRSSAAAPAVGPAPLAGGASDPSISISNYGKAYLSFTALGSGGHDVRAAYYAGGTWSVAPASLDAQPGDDAGAGTARSDVTTSGDGVGIVAWGEAGHIYTRRLRGTAPSTVVEQADVPTLGGWSEISSDQPSLGTGGDSSYAAVTFHEVFASGARRQSRVLLRRLRGSQFEGVTAPDGLSTPGSSGAVQPNVTVSEYGRGFVTAARDNTNQLFAMTLGNNGGSGPVAQVDSLSNASAPDAVPAMAGLYSDLIAWQRDPGGAGAREVRARYSVNGNGLGSELVLSDPGLGPTDADRGLVAAGDVTGNAAVAWVQGSGGTRRIVATLLYVPPGAPAPASGFAYSRGRQPVLSWSPAREQWGPVQYTVVLDGQPVARTTGTAVRVPVPLADGPHTWALAGANPAGLARNSPAATVWVDSVVPVVRLTLRGTRHLGDTLRAYVSYTDAPAPEPRRAASGVGEVLIRWGDRHDYHIAHYKAHAYKRAGRYTITVVVKDRAGNRRAISQVVRITPKPPKSKSKGKGNAGKPAPAPTGDQPTHAPRRESSR
jgi:hypothetical protein